MPLKKPFQVSAGSASRKRNHFISIEDRYHGEAARSVFYGPSEGEIIADLKKGSEILKTRKSISLSDLHDLDKLEINSVSKSALLTAMLHYLSGTSNKYPWEILGLDKPGNIRTSFTVSIDQPDLMMDEIKQSPYPLIKIKMGFEEDELLIPELSKIKGKRFRVDANGGWSPQKGEKMIFLLSRVDIELIEQPTTIEHVDQWKYLKGKSRIPLFVDEGLNNHEDYLRFADYVDGVNIKMSKSGGIIEAKKIALSARKDRRKIMLGCMVESSIGIAPAVYLSSLADYFDLDGPLLLEENIATGINFNLEKVTVAEDIIGGPKLKEKYAG